MNADRKQFLALDILGFYRNSDFDSAASTYTSHLPLSLIWGKAHSQGLYDHLSLNEYNEFDAKFKKCFTLNDLRLFTAFSNMKGGDDNGLILRYIWNIFRQVYERNLVGNYRTKVFAVFDISIHDLNQAITSSDIAQY